MCRGDHAGCPLLLANTHRLRAELKCSLEVGGPALSILVACVARMALTGASGGSHSKWRSDERAARRTACHQKGGSRWWRNRSPSSLHSRNGAGNAGRKAPGTRSLLESREPCSDALCALSETLSARCTETRALGWYLIRCRYPGPKKQSGMEVRSRVTGLLACWQGPPHLWPQNEITFQMVPLRGSLQPVGTLCPLQSLSGKAV